MFVPFFCYQDAKKNEHTESSHDTTRSQRKQVLFIEKKEYKNKLLLDIFHIQCEFFNFRRQQYWSDREKRGIEIITQNKNHKLCDLIWLFLNIQIYTH